MSITSLQVKKVAKLSRLSLSEEECTNFAAQLSSIMGMIDEILEVDCGGVEPLTSVSNSTLRTREDIVGQAQNINDLFLNAPGEDSNLAKDIKCFVVPKVVE